VPRLFSAAGAALALAIALSPLSAGAQPAPTTTPRPSPAASPATTPTPGPAASAPVVPTAAPTLTPAVEDLLHRINATRVSNGRLPLADAVELNEAAQEHSEDMVANAYLDHIGSDGTEPQDRAVRAGYQVPPRSGWIVVEVISAISGDPAGPVNWWFNVDPAVHGKVLLNPRWREFGGGYARGGPYGNYWTVLVGCRPSVVPTVVFDGVPYEHAETCG
jgi:uncharacterized protein YkwD